MEIRSETKLEEVICYMMGLGMTLDEAESMAPNWLRQGDQSPKDVRRGIIEERKRRDSQYTYHGLDV